MATRLNLAKAARKKYREAMEGKDRHIIAKKLKTGEVVAYDPNIQKEVLAQTAAAVDAVQMTESMLEKDSPKRMEYQMMAAALNQACEETKNL